MELEPVAGSSKQKRRRERGKRLRVLGLMNALLLLRRLTIMLVPKWAGLAECRATSARPRLRRFSPQSRQTSKGTGGRHSRITTGPRVPRQQGVKLSDARHHDPANADTRLAECEQRSLVGRRTYMACSIARKLEPCHTNDCGSPRLATSSLSLECSR